MERETNSAEPGWLTSLNERRHAAVAPSSWEAKTKKKKWALIGRAGINQARMSDTRRVRSSWLLQMLLFVSAFRNDVCAASGAR